MPDLLAPVYEGPAIRTLRPEAVRPDNQPRHRRPRFGVLGAACAVTILVASGCQSSHEPTRSASPPPPAETHPVAEVIPAELDLADGLPRSKNLYEAFPGILICGAAFAPGHGAIATEGWPGETMGIWWYGPSACTRTRRPREPRPTTS